MRHIFYLNVALMGSGMLVLTSCAEVKWYMVYIFYFAVCNKNKKIQGKGERISAMLSISTIAPYST